MSFIHTALSVANIAALKALNSTSDPKRVDGVFLAVGDRGDEVPAWYRYVAAATDTESLPNIVSPTDTTGRWFEFSRDSSGGLSVADIAALKALNSTSSPKRVDGGFLAVGDRGDGLPAWYRYNAASTATESLPDIVSPTDTTGRWLQFSGGGSSGVSFGGQIICNSGCAIGGKGFAFFAASAGLKLNVQVGFGISVTAGATSIQIHRWSQEPNTGLTGRVFAAEIPHTGGTVTIDIDSTYRWISFFAKNPSMSGAFDGVCFSVNGNTCTLVGYS